MSHNKLIGSAFGGLIELNNQNMRQSLLRISVLLIIIISSVLRATAQDTTKTTSVDPDLLNLESSRIPKEYTIAGVSITGIRRGKWEILKVLSVIITGSITGTEPDHSSFILKNTGNPVVNQAVFCCKMGERLPVVTIHTSI